MTKTTYKRKGLAELTLPVNKSLSWLGGMAVGSRLGTGAEARGSHPELLKKKKAENGGTWG